MDLSTYHNHQTALAAMTQQIENTNAFSSGVDLDYRGCDDLRRCVLLWTQFFIASPPHEGISFLRGPSPELNRIT